MTEPGRKYIATQLEKDLAAWIRSAVTAFSDVSIYQANQGKVRRRKPCVVLQVLTDDETATPFERLTGNTLPDGSEEVCIGQFDLVEVSVSNLPKLLDRKTRRHQISINKVFDCRCSALHKDECETVHNGEAHDD